MQLLLVDILDPSLQSCGHLIPCRSVVLIQGFDLFKDPGFNRGSFVDEIRQFVDLN